MRSGDNLCRAYAKVGPGCAPAYGSQENVPSHASLTTGFDRLPDLSPGDRVRGGDVQPRADAIGRHILSGRLRTTVSRNFVDISFSISFDTE